MKTFLQKLADDSIYSAHKTKLRKNKTSFFPSLLLLPLCVVLLIPAISAEAQSNFYLADNGVTVMCPDAVVGETGVVNDITYTKRDRASLDALRSADQNNPEFARTCTSGITNMSNLFFKGQINPIHPAKILQTCDICVPSFCIFELKHPFLSHFESIGE